MKKLNLEAVIEHKGVKYRFPPEDLVESPSERFRAPGDPSSWLCRNLVGRARRLWPELPRAKAVRLCAETLRIDVETLESVLDWHAGYQAMRDGVPPDGYHPWLPDQDE